MKIIECPRDAMQGITKFIPTEKKIRYINNLIKVGFDTIDFGSLVSPKVIPQMKDTIEVLNNLDMGGSNTKLLAIIANTRGAMEALDHEEISYLGFPLSISETFQVRNTNKSIIEALNTIEEIQNLCLKKSRTLVTYISMGFGNPYGDPYDVSIVEQFVGILDKIGINVISLADTIGVSEPESITYLFSKLKPAYPHIEFGAHLHSHPDKSKEKIEAAFNAGCDRLDGAIKGFGGCPMAEDELVGNIATESIINYFIENNIRLPLNYELFKESVKEAAYIFPS
ncbi:MAG: hydroxymethylglutaryl-CoA lyase [Bacteroidetes bacterium]|nr:MAG: hydroxymethylglutaryl-CoA lyase [Bacteroidota bacterium]